MKKIMSLFVLAGLFSLMACGPSAEELAAIEQARLDSIAAVEAEMFRLDSIAAAELEMLRIQDSIDAAAAAAAARGNRPSTTTTTTTTTTPTTPAIGAGGRGNQQPDAQPQTGVGGRRN